MNVPVMILAAVLAPSVIYILWGLHMKRPLPGDETALENAEAQLAPEFEAYAARMDSLYGKGE